MSATTSGRLGARAVLASTPGDQPAGEPEVEDLVRILIVDALPDQLRVLRSVLGELGHELVFVRAGREALREVQGRDFAVILMNIGTPDVESFETARRIRLRSHSSDTPIIFITMPVDVAQTERGYALGAVDFIVSPVVPNALRSKVQVFVRLFILQRQLRRLAEDRAAVSATEAVRATAADHDRQTAFLANASRVLNPSLPPAVSRRELARVMVPALATMAVVLGNDDIDSQPEVVLARDGEVRALAWPSLDASVRVALRRAVKERTRVDLDDTMLGALDEAVGGSLLRSKMRDAPRWQRATAVPMLSGDRLLGAIFVASEHDEPVLDWRVLDDLALRAAGALESATLYGTLQGEIVERRAAELQLQEAGRRKDEFLAMLSHELRNPLAPIRTALEVIRRIAPPDPTLHRASDIMARQVQQMTRLIDELVDVARISQGKIALTREKVDLQAVIQQSVESAQPLLDARGQSLEVLPLSEPVWVNGDFLRLAQILSNLLNNASKYSERGAPIRLQARVSRGEAVVSVQDQGVGIDPQLQPRIFDLFAQGSRGLDRAQGGLGVGLTLAKRLAELHGGRLDAVSDGVGRGAEFILYLPRVAGASDREAAAPALGATATAPRCRVLVVDDNLDAAQSVASFFEVNGHEVLTAGDGGEALVAAQCFKPDVVVLDIGLPVMDGYEVAQRLRQMPEVKDALVLALTGYGRRDDLRRSQAAGFDHHFVKPADPMLLLARVENWLRLRASGGGASSGDATSSAATSSGVPGREGARGGDSASR